MSYLMTTHYRNGYTTTECFSTIETAREVLWFKWRDPFAKKTIKTIKIRPRGW